MTEFYVFLITLVTSLACALVGNFLVVRRLALVGDAMSHSMLPGIVLAFLIAGTLRSPLFFIFAVLFALLMGVLINFLHAQVGVFKDSAIGIVFTSFFSLGVILITRYANDVHIDEHAVLFGNVEFAAFERWIFAGIDMGPYALWIMILMLLISGVVLWIFFKEFLITSFDPQLSKSLGINPVIMHYLLLILVSLVVVVAFEITGVILVVALLIVPGTTAFLLSDRMSRMIFLSLLFAFLASISGFFFALFFDVSIAGAVAMMSGLILFFVAGGKTFAESSFINSSPVLYSRHGKNEKR